MKVVKKLYNNDIFIPGPHCAYAGRECRIYRYSPGNQRWFQTFLGSEELYVQYTTASQEQIIYKIRPPWNSLSYRRIFFEEWFIQDKGTYPSQSLSVKWIFSWKKTLDLMRTIQILMTNKSGDFILHTRQYCQWFADHDWTCLLSAWCGSVS